MTATTGGTGHHRCRKGRHAHDDRRRYLIDHLGYGPVLAVGWSLRGSVLQSLLIRHPERLRKAVLLNAFPSYTRLQHGWLDAMLMLRRNGLDPVDVALQGMSWAFTARVLSDHAAAAQAELVRHDPHPTTVAGLEAQAAGLRIYDSRDQLGGVTTPTLVLTSAEDVLTPVAQSVELASRLPNAELRVLPRGGHGMILEYPDDVVGAIVGYLGRDEADQ